VIAMSGNAMMMIHDPMGVAFGAADEMRSTANLLDQIKDQIVATYKTHTVASDAQIRQWMSDETWFTAEAAKAAGFVDEITEPLEVSNCFDLGALHFRNVPKAVANRARAAAASPILDLYRSRLVAAGKAVTRAR